MGGNVVSTLIMVQGYIFVLHGSYHNHMYHIIKLPPFPLSIVVNRYKMNVSVKYLQQYEV